MQRPPIDIIIPFHGQYEKLTQCVSSIMQTTANQIYKLIIVDDGSPNPLYLNDLTYHNKKALPIQLERQSGFAAAVNVGLKYSQNPHIIIMHSDVFVENGNWLLNLQRGLAKLKSEGIKLVSAKTENIGTSNCDPKIMDKENSEDVVAKNPLPLFCTLFHRELIDKIGPLKEYPFAWYEDEEFFYRMKYHNFHQAIIGNSWVKHHGGSTIKEVIKRPKVKHIMESNRELCQQDLKQYLNAS